ncbi:exosome complex exonuclease Rrp41 [Candidatus Woesearchaeota archaeon]|nr:exosome complex exonuclease Rrp41 [Candidatus Woesearchaeota archaeon]
MSYDKRHDGRDWSEHRPIECSSGVIPNADGSARFKIGNTIALAAVYGPRNLYPKFLQDPKKGILRCHYNMMPFSGAGDRVRPGRSRRSQEISLVTEKALLPALELNDFPNAVVDVFIEFPQTDAGSRCAGICAASIALADAGIAMKDLVSAISVGRIGEKLVIDLDYHEEALEGTHVADIPMAIQTRSGKVTLLQMDGLLPPDEMGTVVDMGIEACRKVAEFQKSALKNKFSDKNE